MMPDELMVRYQDALGLQALLGLASESFHSDDILPGGAF